jgi:hypothetical protein
MVTSFLGFPSPWKPSYVRPIEMYLLNCICPAPLYFATRTEEHPSSSLPHRSCIIHYLIRVSYYCIKFP